VMNQGFHRVFSGLGILLKQRAQQRGFVQFQVGGVAIEVTPCLSEVVNHGWRHVVAVIERCVLFHAVVILPHQCQLQTRIRAVAVLLPRVAFRADGGGT
jgi:hypothetical protein